MTIPAPSEEPLPPDPRSWQRVAAVLFAIGWGANHFAPLLPVYRRTLDLDPAAPAILYGVYALGLLPGLLVAGPLSDRLGRRALVRPAAFAALVASALLGALGGSFFALLAGRFAYGLAAGAAMSPGAVWVGELSQEDGPGVGADDVRRIGVPTLVIGTARDAIHPQSHAEALAALIPGARLETITAKADGRAAYVEEFQAALWRFLNALP